MESLVVRRWLAFVCWFLLGMIALGGITRLTQSGLSMVTWEPVMGAVPPLNEKDWEARFAQYQAFPEYQQLNRHMTLGDFKKIFFWEYFHRLWGRLIGVVFAIPFFWFLWRGKIRGALAGKLWLALGLGGLQGALGWYMVKSGLVDDPRVSHFRLAAHLSLALLLLGWLYWIYRRLDPRARSDGSPSAPRGLRRAAGVFAVVLSVQIIYGAFVAGLDAGLLCNTFPKMYGAWIPPQAFDLQTGGLADLVSNPVTLHFLHRALGLCVAGYAITLWWMGRRRPGRALRLVLATTLLQIALGIVTVMWGVPVVVAVWHQVNAVLLLLSVLELLHTLRPVSAAPTSRPVPGI